VQVVPLTTNVSRVYPGEAIIRFGGRPSSALANQLRRVTKERLGGRLGALSASDLRAVELALRVQLGLG
jgi:mRNA interferase MazF